MEREHIVHKSKLGILIDNFSTFVININSLL